MCRGSPSQLTSDVTNNWEAAPTAVVDSTGSTAVGLLGVTKAYGRKSNLVQALRSVSIEFARGTFTAVMGPSGSGKTTLLHCAAGLIRPTSGQVMIGGVDITSLDETALSELRRTRIGVIFQSFNLLPSLSAEQNVALPLRLAGQTPRSQDIRQVLSQVGLGDRARHRPSQLSGGQQQRVAIARALATRPDVLFADEPTGALDTRTSRDVLGLLRDTVDGMGQTVVMVTHDPVAASFADKVVFIADGSLAGELWNPTAEAVAQRLAVWEG